MARAKEREAIKKAFKSKRWEDKVDNMSDSQVFAIYKRLKLQQKVD